MSAEWKSVRDPPLRRVAERPDRRAVRDGDGPLHRELHAGLVPDLLDLADRPSPSPAIGSSCEPERQREVEQHLGVGRAADVRVERRVDGERQVALDLAELRDEAVVHEQPVLVAERMAVRLLDRRPARGAHVAEEQRALDRAGDLAQVLVVPRRLDAVERRRDAARRRSRRIPAEAEAVAVHRSRRRAASSSDCATSECSASRITVEGCSGSPE